MWAFSLPWLLLVSSAASEAASEVAIDYCLEDHAGPPSPEPKYFYYGENQIPITIFSTSRATHLLISNVFKIFAEEVLGYRNVSIVRHPKETFDARIVYSKLSNCNDSK